MAARNSPSSLNQSAVALRSGEVASDNHKLRPSVAPSLIIINRLQRQTCVPTMATFERAQRARQVCPQTSHYGSKRRDMKASLLVPTNKQTNPRCASNVSCELRLVLPTSDWHAHYPRFNLSARARLVCVQTLKFVWSVCLFVGSLAPAQKARKRKEQRALPGKHNGCHLMIARAGATKAISWRS